MYLKDIQQVNNVFIVSCDWITDTTENIFEYYGSIANTA